MRRSCFSSLIPALRIALAAASLGATATARAADPPQPTPDAAAALAAGRSQPPIPYASGAAPQKFAPDPAKITREVLPDGTRVYHMNGQGMESIEAHLGADGKVTYRCTDRAERAASAALDEHAAPENAHEQ